MITILGNAPVPLSCETEINGMARRIKLRRKGLRLMDITAFIASV
jgi:hypothetical protein